MIGSEKMEQSYNLLTKHLLREGYHVHHYPQYVKIPAVYPVTLENVYGGFQYRSDYIQQKNFQTGCGLYVKGKYCLNDMGYMGVDWCFENDNPVVLCPFGSISCKRNHPLLEKREGARSFHFCRCRMTYGYIYDMSVEKLQKLQKSDKDRLLKKFFETHSENMCHHHMFFDERKMEWYFKYQPLRCAKICTGGEYCPLRGRNLTKKKGNLFYDLKVSTVRKDNTFFAGEPIISIIKGKRFLNHSVSLDICTALQHIAADEIYQKEWWNQYSMQHLYDPDLKIEILNIRAGKTEGRDLEQDLQDIQRGIHVVHSSDLEAAKKQKKAEEKKKREQAKTMTLAKKAAQYGLQALDWKEQEFLRKRFGTEELKSVCKREAERGVQLSLADYFEM